MLRNCDIPFAFIDSQTLNIIETSRLSLCKLDLQDSPFIYELTNSPGWLEFIGDRGIRNEQDARQYIESGPRKSYTEHGFGLWRVDLKQEKTSIGICGILKRETLDHPDLGFAFLPSHQKKGFALEAAGATLEYAKKQLSISPVLAITVPSNVSSIRLLDRLGLKFDKRMIQNKDELLQYTTV